MQRLVATEKFHRYSSDRPLERLADDALEREGFVERLSSDILGWHGRDSLVISINGEWGSGKTTMQNFLKETLLKQANPVIIEFNPWQWSAQDRLFEAFFYAVGAAFRITDAKEETIKLTEKWEAFAAWTRIGAAISTKLEQAITPLVGTSITAALLANTSGSPAIRIIGILLGLTGMCVSIFIAIFPDLAEHFVERARARLGKVEIPLPELRRLIAAQLEQLRNDGRSVLIIIDDIDRLRVKEINTLFQLVKANVDFPNLTYLLLYQKDVVEAALSKNVAGRGADYLKKIVQVEIDLPQASRYRMFQIFEESLSRILERADPKMYWGQNRFQDVFLTSVWPFFRTLRDVKRFLATFDFYFNGHINCGVLEVNPIDLFLIEVIRTFDHKSYVLIQSSLAPGPESDSLIALAVDDNVATKRLNEKINAVVSRSELLEVERDQLQAILQNLFPQGKASDSRYEHDLRICHPKHFAKYFEHLLDKAPTSAAGVQDILGIVGNREAFASRLRQFSISGDLEDVFDKILVYFEAVPIEGAHNFIAALFDVGDEFPEERPGILQIDLNVTAARMIYYLLKKIPEEKKREDILMKSLETTGGVVQPVMTIHFLEPDKHERSDLKIFSEEQIERFRKIGVAKLEYFAHSGALWNSRLFARLIFIWRRWAGDEPVKGWLGSELAGAERKLEFLSRFVGRITSGNEIVSYTLGAKSLESLVSLEDLLQGGGQAETGNDLHYAACQLLREALDRKQAGKPYDQIEIFVEKLRLRPDRQ